MLRIHAPELATKQPETFLFRQSQCVFKVYSRSTSIFTAATAGNTCPDLIWILVFNEKPTKSFFQTLQLYEVLNPFFLTVLGLWHDWVYCMIECHCSHPSHFQTLQQTSSDKLTIHYLPRTSRQAKLENSEKSQ